jgi:hypothetical protein
MYKLGYNNNNCIGCVKGGIGYWNKIRKDFPERFNRMAQIERIVGASCLKEQDGTRLFLDELDPNRGVNVKPIVPDCSLTCAIEFAQIEDCHTSKILKGLMSINDVK